MERGIDEAISVAIVPHTHWDREWYEPFQTFRMRLIKLLDQLIPLLEEDLAFRRFLLDGQTQVIDDYLEMRPDMRDRVAALTAAGRVAIGPWMILMDEFMVSGETMVRNLQLGMRRGATFGGVMELGYLPDMFGHVAQMPQILALAGFEDAVLWRGVPRQIDQSGFWWRAPDGSEVRVEYLYGSYSNASAIPDDAAGLVELAREYEAELGAGRVGDMLLMNGTDHQAALPWLGRVVDGANNLQARYRFSVTSLLEFVAQQPRSGLATWEGELRSGARANVLMGVASNRVDTHQRAAAAECALERRAEPLAALYLDAESYPHELLHVAWTKLVLNSAHDSSCACSHDETVDQVNVRYAEARQIADGVARDAVESLATALAVARGSTLVINPTARSRSAVLELTLPGRGPVHLVDGKGAALPSQLVASGGGEAYATVVQGNKVHWLIKTIRSALELGLGIAAAEIDETVTGTHRVVLTPAIAGDVHLDIEPLLTQMRAWGDAGDTLHLTQNAARNRTVALLTDTVPGFGWSRLRVEEGPGTGGTATGDAATLTIANEHITLRVNPADGCYEIVTADGVRASGLGRLVDGGDGGDTYNYSPPTTDRVIDRPESVRAAVTERGPVRSRAEITAVYAWPAHAIGNYHHCESRAYEEVSVAVHTCLELRSGEPFVRVRHSFDNLARDHRLRAHFPLPTAVTGSDAECAFAVVRRGLSAEGGPQEHALPTFPSRRFVDCSDGEQGLALIHRGLLEYEVVDDGRELALTLLRCTGWLSRAEFAFRREAAGPYLETPAAQLIGPRTAEYAVFVHAGDWRRADLYGAADAFSVPLERVRGKASSAEPARSHGSDLSVSGAEVSAVLRDDTGIVVRVVRADPEPGALTINHRGAPARGWFTDLRGRNLEPFEGSAPLRAWQIASIRIS